jgi:hypothetical protein
MGGPMLESLKIRVLHSLPASVLYVTLFRRFILPFQLKSRKPKLLASASSILVRI